MDCQVCNVDVWNILGYRAVRWTIRVTGATGQGRVLEVEIRSDVGVGQRGPRIAL